MHKAVSLHLIEVPTPDLLDTRIQSQLSLRVAFTRTGMTPVEDIIAKEKTRDICSVTHHRSGGHILDARGRVEWL